ncbi:PhnD/SsuA/transferrin family substrate-binding protein [Rhodoferax sp.]|uniref:PhnD/SsuA/transferrin family substrate-binding protein n=1 Tax=Rhodoferax sp. TaxID=50421 RepID=UPI002631C0EE|nr:PhnD/SsuA/transferrin family substrate-binding protein [Rhodoferax sp.]MDD2920042.1 PhnD/SsuA/transferrin family substrate-binding protein [Rhodoferax sp.]
MKMSFRRITCRLRRLLWLCAAVLFFYTPAGAAPVNESIRIGLPDTLLHQQYTLIAELRQYLTNRLKRQVDIVIHRKPDETTVQLDTEKVDFAWVTDYPNAHVKNRIRLLASPLYKGQPFFTSYLIVPKYNHATSSLLQLKGAVFAFTDASQNGSYLDVRYQLLMAGEDPDRFFNKVLFARSHREVVKAVALGLAHAGEVDSMVWDALSVATPGLTAQTRIVARSHVYAAPPWVASAHVSQNDFNELQRALIGMATDPKGNELLKRIGIDGFVPGDENAFERINKMRHALGGE